MATVVDPTTAVQKQVIVSIKDGQTSSEKVFLLEIWSTGNVNSEKTIEVKDENKNISGTFGQVQFKFDKDNNYIYTKVDVNQKGFDKKYSGKASKFSISGLSIGNANIIIRTAKTNSASDLTELYKGSAEHLDVKVEKVTGEAEPTLPTDGRPQPDKGANKDVKTWKTAQMNQDASLWKVVDDKNINVADQFHSEANAQQYIDYYKSQPVNEDEKKNNGGQISDSPPADTELISGVDFDGGEWSKHNTGPRIQHGAELDALNRESEAYFKLLKGQRSDELSWGVRGGPHSNGKDVREYKFYMPISGSEEVFAKEFGPDKEKEYDKVSAKEADKKGFTVFEIKKGNKPGKMGIDLSVEPEKEFGMKVRHYNLDKNGDGIPDAVKLEAFVDFKDGNGWQKYIEGEDDGTKLKGPGPLTRIYKGDERDHIRVDNCGECSEDNHSVYIPGTYKVRRIKEKPGEENRYWPWKNSDDNWEKKEGDKAD